jgi:hypothetical protein
MKRITPQEAEGFIPLLENYTDTKVTSASYFTITPSERGEGWEDVTYFMDRKRNIFSNRGEGDQWVYILSNPIQPGIFKIGYTAQTPDERARQISNATGVALPYEVAWAFRCFNAEQLEGAVHHALNKYRVNSQREFFQISLEEAKETIELIGKNYI